MLDTLEHYSTLSLYSAMAIYAIAFVFFVVDLANRSSVSAAATTATDTKAGAAEARQPSSKAMRIGFSLTVVGFLFHAAATILRGIAAERVPFANMYEFGLSATLAIVGVYLLTQFFVDIRFLGVLVTGMAVLFLGVCKVNYYVAIVPLPPALDTYWLVIHILVAILAVGFFTVSFGLSVLQLFRTRRENQVKIGNTNVMRWASSFPTAVRLEDYAYRTAIIGFVFWSFTLIAGSIWAERAWSRYWGWDTKEVWTFVIWVLYAGFIHARATRGWRGTRSAWLSIIAFSAIIFNYTVVNVFFKGLHAYSGL